MQIILASSSPRRKELLEQIHIPFQICISDVKEVYHSTYPEEIVQELALLKAKASASVYGQSHPLTDVGILGSDTIVAFQGKILGKPKTKEEARSMITMLSGNTHQVYTGIAFLLYNSDGDSSITLHTEKTLVTVAKMTSSEIERYISSEEPYDKAGGYGIQGSFAAYVEQIHGDYFNVMGLPLSYIWKLLSPHLA